MRNLVTLAGSAAAESSRGGGAALRDLALATRPSEVDLTERDADWTFFQKHYRVYMRVAMHWGRMWFHSSFSSDRPDEVLSGPETDEEVLTSVRDMGGTHMTIATVWYAFAVAAGAFKGTGVEYRKSAAQHTALWWMASELLVFADTDDPAQVGVKVITLPGHFTAATVDGDQEASEVAKGESNAMLQAKSGGWEELFNSHMYASDGEGGDDDDEAVEDGAGVSDVDIRQCLEPASFGSTGSKQARC